MYAVLSERRTLKHAVEDTNLTSYSVSQILNYILLLLGW
jgi:hypothetical protein